VENLAYILFDRLDRRQIAPLGVEDQYRPFCRGWNGGKLLATRSKAPLTKALSSMSRHKRSRCTMGTGEATNLSQEPR